MATVVGHMAAISDPRVDVTLVTTYIDAPAAQRIRTGLAGMARGTVAVARRDVDVVHVHLSHGGSVVRKAPLLWAARLRGVPAVVHGHSFDFGGWMARLPAPARSLVRAALPADRWLVLGAGLAAEYAEALRLAPARVEVLYNPVPALPTRATEGLAADGIVRAVALGRLGVRKGSYDLVAAVAALPPDVRSRLHLTLAGDGEVDEVRAAVAAAGVEEAVTVRGWVDPAGRDALLAASQVFALPSYDEGLPMALLEAMAAGLAPLTTPWARSPTRSPTATTGSSCRRGRPRAGHRAHAVGRGSGAAIPPRCRGPFPCGRFRPRGVACQAQRAVVRARAAMTRSTSAASDLADTGAAKTRS